MHRNTPGCTDIPRTLNAGYIRVLLAYLRQAGLDPSRFCSAARLLELEQPDPLARYPLAEWEQMMADAEAELGNADLPLALAEYVKPWHTGLIGFTLMTSRDINEVGLSLARFHHLLNDAYDVKTGFAGGRFGVTLWPTSGERSERLERLSLCTWSQRMRWLTGQPDLRFDASFTCRPPVNREAYERHFGGVVKFDQARSALYGAAEQAKLSVIQQDPDIHRMLHQQALSQLEQLSKRRSGLMEKVEALVRQAMASGHITLEQVASQLQMSPRTLQTRLDENGLSFRTLVEGIRRAHAEHCLQDSKTQLSALALALGFANQASFNRAFRRWTGLAPGEYRRRAVAKRARSAVAEPPETDPDLRYTEA